MPGRGFGFGGSGSSGGSWALQKEQIVAGADATTISFTGLDLEAAKMYWLLCAGQNNTAGGTTIVMTLNADATSNHYYNQRLRCYASSVVSANSNDNQIAQPLGNLEWTSSIILQKLAGYHAQAMIDTQFGIGSTMERHIFSWCKNDSTANITSLELTDGIGAHIKVGSRFTLLKYTGV